MVLSFECFLRECEAAKVSVQLVPILVGTKIRFTAIARRSDGGGVERHRIDCEVRGEQAIALQFPADSERCLGDHISVTGERGPA